MIKNEKQYKISKKKFTDTVAEIKRVKEATDQDPLRNKLLVAALMNVKENLDHEITVYESLKNTPPKTLAERMIAELPSILTEFKIITGLTQKEFAEILGVKEQQLQRYEADNFKGVTFKTLLKFLDVLGLEITIKETRLNKSRKKVARQRNTPQRH
ncbi:helix-turn-helix transcriptional regulator [Paraflavitalea sp. CAU 1676]|uniref:helix-turn-helix domain-containing protein n=1 Tax=Paraflavitalea sp. CAU 1676 TaxID=3032598 RepID=UPI0023DB22E0|nr:helix-turn-helix transcriptional regulator [Paraflavitalea sp. CAU 1676]MDF2190730.1 helix-turn-helix transcriptional regulator [Paraflavitalea sp. CAU 1676]